MPVLQIKYTSNEELHYKFDNLPYQVFTTVDPQRELQMLK